MSSFSNLLLEDCQDKLAAESVDYLRRICSAAQRMDDLIRDVLSYNRVLRGEIQLASVKLGPLLSEIILQYPHLQADQAEIELVEPLLAVQGNTALLTQCFSNLLDNAVKFVPPGTKPRIRIWTEERAGQVRVCVRDNGIGIETHQLGRIWRIFERLHHQSEYPGTGIGLSIVKRGVERMGGTAGVESQAGSGSVFWFELAKAQEGSP